LVLVERLLELREGLVCLIPSHQLEDYNIHMQQELEALLVLEMWEAELHHQLFRVAAVAETEVQVPLVLVKLEVMAELEQHLLLRDNQ